MSTATTGVDPKVLRLRQHAYIASNGLVHVETFEGIATAKAAAELATGKPMRLCGRSTFGFYMFEEA